MAGQDVSGPNARKQAPKIDGESPAASLPAQSSSPGTSRAPGPGPSPASSASAPAKPAPASAAPGGKSGSSADASKQKVRWEDYLQEAPKGIPSLTGVHALDELTHAETPGRPTAAPPRPAPSPPLGAPQVQRGPFEVGPGIDRRPQPEDSSAVGWRMIAVLVLCFAWLILSVLPGPSPDPMPQAASAGELAEGQYGRFELPVDTHLPVIWMVKTHGSLVAIMTPGWERQPEAEKVETLRMLQAVSGGAEEVLLLNERSDLLGELYNGRYHFYP